MPPLTRCSPRPLVICFLALHRLCSQFTSYLDIVQGALATEGIAAARLDGKTPAKRCGEVLQGFQSGESAGLAELDACGACSQL